MGTLIDPDAHIDLDGNVCGGGGMWLGLAGMRGRWGRWRARWGVLRCSGGLVMVETVIGLLPPPFITTTLTPTTLSVGVGVQVSFG